MPESASFKSFHSRIFGLPAPNISSSGLSAGYFALLAT